MWLTYLALIVLMHISKADFKSLMNAENKSNHLNKKTTFISIAAGNCLFVTSETGYFIYNSTTNSKAVCGIYLITDPENLVEITFTDFDVPCNNRSIVGNLVQYLDGWELNGEVFPTSTNLPINLPEVKEFCSDNKPSDKKIVSSQNGALIAYRIPEVGKGFTIFVEHKKHPSPCNIIHIDESYYILNNYGKRLNCSIWAPYPVVFKFNSYSVGNPQSTEILYSKCSGFANRIEIGGGGLDTNRVEILDSICNNSISYGKKEEIVLCSTTTIKLVSDGSFKNYLNVSMRLATRDEILNANVKYQCNSSTVK